MKVHVNVGTIGHIDDGKTTLTAAILAVQAEKGLAEAKPYGEIAKGGNVPVIRGNAKGALENPAAPKARQCIEELLAALDTTIPEPKRLLDRPFLMAIEGVHQIEGRGTVVTGRIEQGRVRIGDKVQ